MGTFTDLFWMRRLHQNKIPGESLTSAECDMRGVMFTSLPPPLSICPILGASSGPGAQICSQFAPGVLRESRDRGPGGPPGRVIAILKTSCSVRRSVQPSSGTSSTTRDFTRTSSSPIARNSFTKRIPILVSCRFVFLKRFLTVFTIVSEVKDYCCLG